MVLRTIGIALSVLMAAPLAAPIAAFEISH
jgi:hypothetical protein